jgi:hypothetical protein
MSGLFILLATAAVLFLPGLLLAWVADLPVLATVGLAPAGTYGLVAVAITLFPPLGVPWNVGTFLLLTAACTAVLVAIRWALLRRTDTAAGPPRFTWGRRPGLLVAGACAVSGLVGAVVLGRATGWYTAYAQGYDATFHANAIRVMADSHDVSSTVLAEVADLGADHYFYPNAYHALGALVVQLGGSVQGTVDAQLALTPFWLATGLAALAWALRSRASVAALAALLACAVVALPYDLVAWGPLLPYVTAAVLVPAVCAAAASSLDESSGGVGWLLLGLLMAGLLALHPSVALAAGIALLCFLLQRWATGRRRLVSDLLRLGGAAVLTVVLGMSQLVGALDTKASASVPVDWPANRTLGSALTELLTFNIHLDPDHYPNRPQVWLAVFLVIGLLTLARLREWWWFVGAGAVFGALFVVTAAYEGPWVSALTDYWWNDRYRFAALAVPPMIVITAHGIVRVVDLVVNTVARRGGSPALWRPLVGATAVLTLVLATNGLYAGSNQRQIATAFGAGPSGGSEESEALAFLQGVAPAGARVLNDPFDGSAWMWAAYGLRPVFGQALFFPGDRIRMGPDRLSLYDSFRAIDTDPQVQGAVQRLDVQYVFLGHQMLNEYIPRAPGLTQLDDVHSVELIFRNSEASVYRVTVQTPTP